MTHLVKSFGAPTWVDDFTRCTWVKFLSHNFQRFGAHTMFREGHPFNW